MQVQDWNEFSRFGCFILHSTLVVDGVWPGLFALGAVPGNKSIQDFGSSITILLCFSPLFENDIGDSIETLEHPDLLSLLSGETLGTPEAPKSVTPICMCLSIGISMLLLFHNKLPFILVEVDWQPSWAALCIF